MKTKKTYAFIAVLIIAVGALAWFIWFSFAQKSWIPKRPADTSLEFWIAEDVSEVDWSGHDEAYGMFGGHAYLGGDYPLKEGEIPKEHIIYTVTAWPDYSDTGRHITRIEITDPAVCVCGLTTASAFAEFDHTFRQQGYKIEVEENEFHEIHYAKKGRVSFILRSGIFAADSGPESALIISAEVSNREGIVF